MMRAQNEPRRVYNRNDVTHVLFGGTYYAPGKATQINPNREVKIEAAPSAGGKKRVHVRQVVNRKTVTEVWRETQVPVHHQG